MSGHRRARLLLLPLGLASIALTLLAAPAAAASGITSEDQIVISGRVDVPADRTVGQVVIFNGPVTVDGTADGNLFALNGDVTISGTVTGDVFVANGHVALTDGAHVGGDLVTRTSPDLAAGARVDGERRTVNADVAFGRVAWLGAVAVWIAVTISTLALGLLLILFAPRAGEAVAEAASKRVGASIGWGLALFFGLPIVAVLAIATLVGIPFGIGILLGLALIYTLGYTAFSFALGRMLLKSPTNRYLAFLLGWGIVRGASLTPFLTGAVWFVSIVYGLGALAVAARGAGRTMPAAPLAPGGIPPPPAPAS
jgi:hypothetical protein